MEEVEETPEPPGEVEDEPDAVIIARLERLIGLSRKERERLEIRYRDSEDVESEW